MSSRRGFLGAVASLFGVAATSKLPVPIPAAEPVLIEPEFPPEVMKVLREQRTVFVTDEWLADAGTSSFVDEWIRSQVLAESHSGIKCDKDLRC